MWYFWKRWSHSSSPSYNRTKPFFFPTFVFVSILLAIHRSQLPTLGGTTITRNALPKKEYPLQCVTRINATQTCPNDYPTTFEVKDPSTRTCPDYFKWIHEDLRPWSAKGITREMVESARPLASFRLVVIDGKVYWEKLQWVYQTRDVFTIWGILQLLRKYPGKLPDLDIMFEAKDIPVVRKAKYRGAEKAKAPPMFHFCGDDYSFDIAFPDWSFWGWPELNIKGWEGLKKDLEEGNKKVSFKERSAFAFWKGNTYMGPNRLKLVNCNSTHKWNAHIAYQDWGQEATHGFKSSNLADQCIHRYKIYIEGTAWSVSEKYILACDSMTLLVTPIWYEFYTRSMEPLKHYWPINPRNLCPSIKYAVDWGNNHKEKAEKIGKEGAKFVQEEIRMENVYDYMFHLLNGYGKLLKYKPTVPEGAIEICPETLACSEEGLQRKFRFDSLVEAPSRTNPCVLSPPQDPQVLQAFLHKQVRVRRTVDNWVSMGNLSIDHISI